MFRTTGLHLSFNPSPIALVNPAATSPETSSRFFSKNPNRSPQWPKKSSALEGLDVRFAQNKFEQQIQHEYQSFKGSGQAFVSLGGVNLLGSSAVVESISLVGVPWNT